MSEENGKWQHQGAGKGKIKVFHTTKYAPKIVGSMEEARAYIESQNMKWEKQDLEKLKKQVTADSLKALPKLFNPYSGKTETLPDSAKFKLRKKKIERDAFKSIERIEKDIKPLKNKKLSGTLTPSDSIRLDALNKQRDFEYEVIGGAKQKEEPVEVEKKPTAMSKAWDAFQKWAGPDVTSKKGYVQKNYPERLKALELERNKLGQSNTEFLKDTGYTTLLSYAKGQLGEEFEEERKKADPLGLFVEE